MGPVTAELDRDAHDLFAIARSQGMPVPEFGTGWYGYLGELITVDYLRTNGVPVGYPEQWAHYDVTVPAGTVEIKTSSTWREPAPGFHHKVPDYARRYQQPDWYVFVVILAKGLTPHTWQLAGACTPTQLDEHGTHMPEPLYPDRVKAGRWIPSTVIEGRALTPLPELLDAWKVPA